MDFAIFCYIHLSVIISLLIFPAPLPSAVMDSISRRDKVFSPFKGSHKKSFKILEECQEVKCVLLKDKKIVQAIIYVITKQTKNSKMYKISNHSKMCFSLLISRLTFLFLKVLWGLFIYGTGLAGSSFQAIWLTSTFPLEDYTDRTFLSDWLSIDLVALKWLVTGKVWRWSFHKLYIFGRLFLKQILLNCIEWTCLFRAVVPNLFLFVYSF